VKIATRDASALTDADLDEFAAMGGAFGIGAVSKAKDAWVLATTAYDGKTLAGFMFLTLERLGGTPCVVMGLLSVKRTAKRDAAMKGLMTEAYHRALMAFPDEDVVIGARFVTPAGLEAFAAVTSMIPRPKYNAVGRKDTRVESGRPRGCADRNLLVGNHDRRNPFVVSMAASVRRTRHCIVLCRPPGIPRALFGG